MRVALVGHCGPDMSYLMLAVNSVAKVPIERINDEEALQEFLTPRDDGLMLVNRALDGDFPDESGAELIGRIRAQNPHIKSMLISNYDDAQSAAVKAGALRGFGKRDIGSEKVKQLLRTALGVGEFTADKHR